MKEVARPTGPPVIAPLLFGLLSAVDVAQERVDAPLAASQHLMMLEEVVVTAQRREERRQNVPISAAVLSSEQLERAQVVNLDSLQYAVANLTNAPSQTSRTSTSFAMRGQFERDTAPTVDPTVGLYLDGVYIGRMTGANLDLIDMQRVEVLRGPQGTLFGRNTIGGAISLIPNRPTTKFEGRVKGTVGNYGRAELSAVANVPFANDRYAVRVVASHSDHRGYGRNTLLDVDVSDDNTDFVRAQMRFAPSTRRDLNLAFDYSRINSGSQLRTLLYVSPDATMLPVILGNPTDSLAHYVDPVTRTVLSDRAGSSTTRVWGAAGTLKLDFAHLSFKSISAYRKLEARVFDSDQDGTPYDLGVILFRDDRQHQLSQEFQLYGAALNGRLDWIGGLHYFDEQATFNQRFRVFVPAAANWQESLPDGDVANDSLAGYAQMAYASTPRLRLTVGARYTEDARQLTSRNARIVGSATLCRLDPMIRDEPGVCRATLPSRRFRYLPWTLGVDFSPSANAMVYAKLSRGHRSGGYNLRGATVVDLSTFEPEQVTAYELGAKTDWFNHHLRINLALFHSLLDDIQLFQREPTASGLPGTPYIQNAGQARAEGGELEVAALLGGWRLTGNIGITRPAFTHLNANVVDVTLHSKFLHTPAWTGSLTADLPVAVSYGKINLHADYAWRDDVSFVYDPKSPARQAAYGLLNAMLSVRLDNANFEFILWGRNLTDRRYITRAFDSDFYISATPGDPRTIGVSLAYRLPGP